MQWQKMLIVDLESTCFQDKDADKPEGWAAEKDQEIIEIGAVILNLAQLEVIADRSFLVRPQGPMGVFCKELTSLTPEDVVDQPDLAATIPELRAWCKENRFDIKSMPWASWGDYDRVQFYRECARKSIPYPFGRAHYNIKGLFSMLQGRERGYGVEKALSILGIEFDGRPHRGIDDANNIARIFIRTVGGAR